MKLEIQKHEDYLRVAVIDKDGALVGYGFVGSDNNGGYQINRIESWASPTNKINIIDSIKSKLSVKRFNLVS
jgi:hypothetical protein